MGNVIPPNRTTRVKQLMAVTQKFFRVDWNAGGKGLAHQYVIS
jgi:hypothetical protein